MANFIHDNVTLPVRYDDKPVQPNKVTTSFSAADLKTLTDALYDTKAHTSGWVNVRSYGADGAALVSAAAAAASAGSGLLIGAPITISTAVGTISVPVRFEGGGRLVLNTGGSVTLTGPMTAHLAQVFDTSGGGTLTFQAKVDRVVPQWWGAKADGAHDDTAAIQAAIDTCASASGGVVFLPGGYYKTTGVKITSPKCTLRGGGRYATALLGTVGANVITLEATNAGLYAAHVEDLQIASFDGANKAARGIVFAGATGQTSAYHYDYLLSRLVITQLSGEGIHFQSNLSWFAGGRVEHVKIYGGTYGVRSDVTSESNHTTFSQLVIQYTSLYAFYFKLPAGITLDNCDLSENLQSLLGVDSAHFGGVVVNGGWWEANATNLTGGPYPMVTLAKTVSNGDVNVVAPDGSYGHGGLVVFRNVHGPPNGPVYGSTRTNDGWLFVKVLTDYVVGPIVVDNCNMRVSHLGGNTGVVDVDPVDLDPGAAWAVKAKVELRGMRTPPIVRGTTAYLVDVQAAETITDAGSWTETWGDGGPDHTCNAGPPCAGLNDFQAYLTHATDNVGHVFQFKIVSNGTPDQMQWRVDGGAWSGNLPTPGGMTYLPAPYGYVWYKFVTATTGHTVGDTWTVTTTVMNPLNVSGTDGNTRFRVLNDGTVSYGTPGSTTLSSLKADGSGNLSLTTGSLNAPTYSSGSTPAWAGALRLSSGNDIRSRNSANNADVQWAQFSSSDQTVLGNVGYSTVFVASLASEPAGISTDGQFYVFGSSYPTLRVRAGGVKVAVARAEIPSTDRGDTSQTLTVGTDAPIQRWATTLTANRTITLSTTGAVAGDKFTIVRSGLGAYTLDVGGLKTLPSATAAWADVVYTGAAWVLVRYGTL